MKEDEMGGAYDKCGDKRKAYGVLVGTHKGRRPVGRTNHRWD
jgi:hypothetical protein